MTTIRMLRAPLAARKDVALIAHSSGVPSALSSDPGGVGAVACLQVMVMDLAGKDRGAEKEAVI